MVELPCLRTTIRRISAVMDRNQDYLIQLDQQNGDGDLGLSMAAGYRAVCGCLDACEETDLGRILMKAAGAFNEAAPSTLGTLSSLFLMGMAKALKGKTDTDLPGLAAAMAAGLEHMMAKCGAKPGEKTIVDALAAGVAELQARSGETPAVAFALAAQAAEAGSEATRGMRAVHGRAAYYGDKSVGVLDGGSVVGALVFRAVADGL